MSLCKISTRVPSVAMLSAALFFIGQGFTPTSGHTQTTRSLFTKAPAPKAMGKASDNVALPATIIRSQSVYINFDALLGVNPPENQAKTAADSHEPLVLNLFPDVVLKTVLNRTDNPSSQSTAYTGSVEGEEHSQVNLVAQDGIVAGNIRTRDTLYQVRYTGHGAHTIAEIDEDAFPPELAPIPVDIPGAKVDFSPALALAKAGGTPIIDALVVYTPAARAAVGGTTAMQALIGLAVLEANTAYANSGVTQRLRLVHTAEVAYTESGFMAHDLNMLRHSIDGLMDEVHTMRDTYGADVVSLLVDDDSYCGVGFQMSTPTPEFERFAFSAAYWQCATGNFTFAHELGHNMGCTHDPQSGAGGSHPYSFGYIAPDSTFRTIMSYPTPCDGCPRILHFSNPSVGFNGSPTGVENAMDNARSLNENAAIVASWRGTTNNPSPPNISVNPLSADFGALPIGQLSTQSFTVTNSGTALLEIETISLSGIDAAEFVIQMDTCSGRSLSPQAECIVQVASMPMTAGLKTATLGVPSNDPDTALLDVMLSSSGKIIPTAATDHFKVYQAGAAKGQPRFSSLVVSLQDAFETKETSILRPVSFGNPVGIDDEGILDPTTGLTCYQIRDVGGQAKFTQRDVVVENQFGSQTFTVAGVQDLCLAANEVGVPSASPLDNYKCYSVRTKKGTPNLTQQRVVLSDSFEDRIMTATRPQTVCNPVNTGTGVFNPSAHLTCYQVSSVGGQPKFAPQTVTLEDELGSAIFEIPRVQSLCVSSSLTELD